jgi:hypothetical protein
MQSVHKNFTTLNEAVNFVQAFSEHQRALQRKPAAAYASWETDDDPADVLRSQMPLTSGRPESQSLQALMEALNKRID